MNLVYVYVMIITKSGFDYMIAGEYKGGDIPKGMEVYEIPALEWAKFKCVGPMPEALQTINTRIFNEWIQVTPTMILQEKLI